ncbi:uncharacterized protein LOC119381526 [Rhipicephalus sanguineus]|uniref:Uncharacterized protein n=1 Tax=Rhipicephalus sanguineus TaxID=34632 RepID=A0A9D4Q713_RHISA|nr:uncharacterized protein LOC119381526 [Rhipicephalus sanguineus]KAH7969534.1 hypothetical protein HPB52_019310 [Rhipicephalus sanguineus]
MTYFRANLQALYYFTEAKRRAERTSKKERVNRRNLRAVREYVDVVVRRLRNDVLLEDVGTAELRSTGDRCGWKLRDGTIRGLDHISHDGKPWLIQVPHCEGDVGTTAPQRYDVAATVLVRDCDFEAVYYYAGTGQQVSGKVSGKVEIVRLDVVIAHPEGPGGTPEVKVFEAKEFTGLTLAKGNIGILHQKLITEVTAEAVRSCVAQAMTSRIAPLLTTVLKGIAYPEFTNMQS